MTLLPDNGNTTSLKLLKTAAIPAGRLRKPLKILLQSFTRKVFLFRYLGRYLARSPIAEYRITDITDKEVTFFFNDLANDKKKTYITMSSEKFISHILIHLPPKNFKMVNRYGFYSRHIYCPVCKVKMIVWEFYHYRYPPLKKYY